MQMLPQRQWAFSLEQIHFELAQSDCFPPNSWKALELKRYLNLENIYFSIYTWALPPVWKDCKLSLQILLPFLHRNKIVATVWLARLYFLLPLQLGVTAGHSGQKWHAFSWPVSSDSRKTFSTLSPSFRKQTGHSGDPACTRWCPGRWSSQDQRNLGPECPCEAELPSKLAALKCSMGMKQMIILFELLYLKVFLLEQFSFILTNTSRSSYIV